MLPHYSVSLSLSQSKFFPKNPFLLEKNLFSYELEKEPLEVAQEVVRTFESDDQ